MVAIYDNWLFNEQKTGIYQNNKHSSIVNLLK